MNCDLHVADQFTKGGFHASNFHINHADDSRRHRGGPASPPGAFKSGNLYAIGFEREIVLTLIQAGTMKMPLAKIPVLATVLQIDAAELLKVALRESDPELAKLIEDTFNPLRLTAIEVAQIEHQRSLSGDAVGAPITLQGNGVIALVAGSRWPTRPLRN